MQLRPFSTKQKVIVLILILIQIVLAIHAFNFYGVERDEGMILSSAMRVAHGQVMYRDFFEFWTPGTVYLSALILKLAGLYYWPIHLLHLSIYVINLILIIILARKLLLTPSQQLILMIFFILTRFSLESLNHHWFGATGLIATAILLLELLHTTHPKRIIFLIGLTAGIASIFMQFEGAIAIICSLIIIPLYAPQSLRRIRGIIVFSTGLAIPASVILAYFISQHAFSQLLYSVIIFPLTQYNQVNNTGTNIVLLTQIILGLLSAVAIVYKRWLNPQISILLIATAVSQIASLTNTSYFFAVFNGYFIQILIIFTLSRFLLACNWQKNLTLTGVRYLSQKLFALPTRYFVPIFLYIPVFLCYIATISIISAISWSDLLLQSRALVQTPAGNLAIPSQIAPRVQSIQTYISQHIQPSEKIYFGPYSSYYYFLFHRQNPTRYSQLTPKYNPDWMFKDAADQLILQNVTYAFILPKESVFAFPANNLLFQTITHNYKIATYPADFPTMPERKKIKQDDPPDAIWQRDTTATQ